MRWYYWSVILLIILIIGSLIPKRPSLWDLERFFIYPDVQDVQDVQEPIIEPFGFEDPADYNLVVSGLDDCDAIIGTGDGQRDMFDFSNRFITAQIAASNDIDVFPRPLRQCK